jgi:DNA-binding XRE family transcriptional regulator
MKTISAVPPRKLLRKEGAFNGHRRIFHCNINFLREQKGLSLRDVEKHSGISHSTLCRAEAGLRVNLDAALRIARFFETSVEKLWTLRPEPGRAKTK